MTDASESPRQSDRERQSGPGTERRAPGWAIAAVTAAVSGVSVFVNSYGVHAMPDAADYTTAKNLVAAIVLALAAAGAWRGVQRRQGGDREVGIGAGRTVGIGAGRITAGEIAGGRWTTALGLGYVGIVGGGIAFVLFFEGLTKTAAEPAAFLHDTLLVWVALVAPFVLKERIAIWNLGAIALLISGQVAITGGLGHLVAGPGETLVLSATLLWSVETVVAKRLLRHLSPMRLAVVRMGVGSAVLVVYVAMSGGWNGLVHIDGDQLRWALCTGLLLALYVGTWMVALSRARAVDVTSVLAASVIVTELLEVSAGHAVPASAAWGMAVVAAGAAVLAVAWPRRSPQPVVGP